MRINRIQGHRLGCTLSKDVRVPYKKVYGILGREWDGVVSSVKGPTMRTGDRWAVDTPREMCIR